MGTKLGVLIGFGAGYYLGARAGRERYEQLNEWIENARQSGPGQTARDLVDQASERARGGGSRGNASYADMSRDQLYERAQELGIEGRSDMTKDALIAALRRRQ